jgi:hypothetical protein
VVAEEEAEVLVAGEDISVSVAVSAVVVVVGKIRRGKRSICDF